MKRKVMRMLHIRKYKCVYHRAYRVYRDVHQAKHNTIIGFMMGNIVVTDFI